MSVTTIPRTLVRAGLSGLRLPLSLAQRVTGNDGGDWPPTIAYESLEAELKIVLGSLIRDEGLVHEGALQQEKIREVTTASRLERKADDIRAEADEEFEHRTVAVDQAAQRIEADALDREDQILLEQAVEEEDLEHEAEVSREAVARRASARDKAVTAGERRAARTRIAAESGALSARSEALLAANRAKAVEKRLEAQKATRKS
jgi:hypothetical protein